MMYGVRIFSSGTKAHQRTRPVRIKHLVTWPHWLSFHLSHCERVAIRQALFSSMDGSVTVVITVYMGRICLCKYVRLMHGGLSGMSPIRPASLSSCQSHLNRTTGPEPDSNSSTDECVWVCTFIFCRLSLSFSPALVAYKDCGPRARPRGTSLFGEPIVRYHVQITRNCIANMRNHVAIIKTNTLWAYNRQQCTWHQIFNKVFRRKYYL